MFNGLDYNGLTRFKGWITGFLALKVDKETGKGLSTNDYTTSEKNKLSGIESGAQVNTVTSVNGKTGDVSFGATWYGTCSTSASTTAKVINCTNFTLKKGSIVSFLSTTSNTASAPTLNVNSTGATALYYGSSVTSATNSCKWAANTVVTVMYDGTYWRLLSVTPQLDGGVYYGTCGTTATSSSKSVTCATFHLQVGSLIYVKTTTAQTYVSGSISLNVNSTGAKTIYYNNTATSSSNTVTWGIGEIIPFVYDGSYWHCLKVSTGSGGGGSSDLKNADIVIGDTIVETDIDTGDVKTTVFSSDGNTITETIRTSGGTVKNTITTTFDGNTIHVRYT